MTYLCLAANIAQGYIKALEEKEEAVTEFDMLDCTTSEEQQKEWAAQQELAHLSRLEDISVMDIYNSTLEDGV